MQASSANTYQITNEFDNRPIGVFDSGVGGISIAKCIKETLSNESLIYIADSLHAPYGEKPTTFIIERVNKIAEKFIQLDVKAIVIACNTATVNAIDQLREKVSIPIIGVEPAIKPAAIQSTTKTVGILVTQATAKNQRFLALVNQFKLDTEVIIQPCPGLVNIVEEYKLHSPESIRLLKQYLTPLIDSGVDKVVLGCTHYPFLIDEINDIVGENICVMETALPVTQELTRKLTQNQLNASSNNEVTYTFLSSKKVIKQQQLFSKLWQSSIKTVGLFE